MIMSNNAESMLQVMLSSKAKGELLVLFHKNPGLIDDADGIARRVGRSGQIITGDIEDLVGLGILQTKDVGKSKVIFLDRAKDSQTKDLIGSYLANLRK
jgi:hypothetical protein